MAALDRLGTRRAVRHLALRSIDRLSIPRYAQAVKSRGILFSVLALGLAGLSFAAARHHVWVITAAALALALWMADLARRDLRAR